MTGKSKTLPSQDSYALVAKSSEVIEAPVLPYQPPMPADRSIPIALIGSGGIAAAHLEAYAKFGLNVALVCDRNLDRAEDRRDTYFPNARVSTDANEAIKDPKIQVVDLAIHVDGRQPLIELALNNGKHVLSQKPFVNDIPAGRRLADLAEEKGLHLAVNQNGRWAPYMSYMREAVLAGVIGQVTGVHAALQWDHTWIERTKFAEMEQVILQDFAIHWFDFVASVIGDTAQWIFASGTQTHGQSFNSNLAAQSVIGFPGGQASLVFDGAAKFGPQNSTTIVGTKGTLHSIGTDLGEQAVSVFVENGTGMPELERNWFNDGFAGTMGALLVAIESGVAPSNNARDSLASLALAHGAIESAKTGMVVRLR